jgi:hypothetical protein
MLLKSRKSTKSIRNSNRKKEKSFIYAKDSKPKSIINGLKSSKNAEISER